MIAFLGGSGAYFLRKSSFGQILKKTVLKTPFGDSNPIYRIKTPQGFEILFLSRHGEKRYDKTAPYVNYRANIFALKKLGADRIISWTGPGALNSAYGPGSIVIPSDVLDFTKNRPLTFFENSGIGFVRQNPVFCPILREALKKSMLRLGVKFFYGGTYACTEGPRLETPSEIKALKGLGADMVGMTLVPELFLAKELEMCYASVCYITNYAEGLVKTPFVKGVLFEGMLSDKDKNKVDEALNLLPAILLEAASLLQDTPRSCPCPHLLERYRKDGRLGKNVLKEIENARKR